MLTCASLRTRTESVTKEVMQVIRAKGAHRRRKAPRFALGPSAGWRVLSVLAMGLFGAILLAPGAAVAKSAPAKASLNVVVIGDLYSYGAATSSNAELRHAAPPTLQALNQIQAANKGVRLNVLFIPVTEASPALLTQPSGSGTSKRQALIKAVSGASVVIVGVGEGNASLAASMRSVLFGTSAPQSTFNQLMSSIDSGTYLQNQTALLNEVAANAAPGASIISIGYPGMQPEQLGSGLHFFSPYTLTTVSQQQANASAQLVSALNTADNQATSIVAAQNHSLHFLFANLSAVAQSTGSSSKGHTHSKTGVVSSQSQPSDLNLLGSAMVPYVDQAVNDQLAAKGVMGAQSIPVLTPTAPWNLQVLVPLSPQSQPSSSSSSNSGVNAPPAPVTQPNQPNPVVPPQVGPSSGGNGSGGSGGHHSGGGGSGGVGISIGSGGVGISIGTGGNGNGKNGGGSTGTGSTGSGGGSSTGTGSSGGNGLSNPSPGSGQANPGSQPGDGQPNQGSGSNHPAVQPGSSQPGTSPGRPGPCGNSAEPNAAVTCSPANTTPTPSASPSPAQPVTLPMQPSTPSSNPSTALASSPACSATKLFGMSLSGCGTQPGQSQGGTGPLTPMVPAPPAPLPKPIAPVQTPGTPTGNTGTSASSPTASSSPATSQSSTAPPTTTAATSPSSQPGDSSAPATSPFSQPSGSSAPATTPSSQPAPATATAPGAATTTALGNTAAGGSTTPAGLSTSATGGNTTATGGSTANGSSATATGGAAATRGNTAAGGSNTTTTGGSSASAGGSTASGGGGGSGGGGTSGS